MQQHNRIFSWHRTQQWRSSEKNCQLCGIPRPPFCIFHDWRPTIFLVIYSSPRISDLLNKTHGRTNSHLISTTYCDSGHATPKCRYRKRDLSNTQYLMCSRNKWGISITVAVRWLRLCRYVILPATNMTKQQTCVLKKICMMMLATVISLLRNLIPTITKKNLYLYTSFSVLVTPCITIRKYKITSVWVTNKI
jgi:hypothetical protein